MQPARIKPHAKEQTNNPVQRPHLRGQGTKKETPKDQQSLRSRNSSPALRPESGRDGAGREGGRTQGKPSRSRGSKAENNSWHPSTSRAIQGEHAAKTRAIPQAQARAVQGRPQLGCTAAVGPGRRAGCNLLRACESREQGRYGGDTPRGNEATMAC